ncbi:MAG: hypothetical protein KGR46_08375 [Verrucomicrobia bacterium]|nr:hypothetical protein [Verrucomicrobiota bacterium]
MKRTPIALLALGVLLTGCAGTLASRSQKLELGMPKERTIKILGSNFTTVAAREELDGRKIEVLRFEDAKKSEVLAYFRDNRLVQWGDASALASMPQ